jgi:ribosomal protein S12 methylthiotransferase
VLRTTFIVGFPGETEREFEELCAFVSEARFERLGVFTYSYEPGTPAIRLPDHLPEEVKIQRRDALMALQQPIAFAFNQSLVGKRLDVLIDGPYSGGPGLWQGRTYADAPDVDGLAIIEGAGIQTGDLVPCTIVGAQGYDLIARADSGRPKPRRARPKPRKKPGSPFTILH